MVAAGFCFLLMAATVGLDEETPKLQKILRIAEGSFNRGIEERRDPKKSRRHFQKSAQAYRALFQSGVHNGALLNNLGKASLLADDIPQAILAWRLGLLLEPNNAEMWDNLQYARLQVDYPFQDLAEQTMTDPWPVWLPRPTGFYLLVSLYVLFVAYCLWSTRRLIVFGFTWRWIAGNVSAVVAFSTGLVYLADWEKERTGIEIVVITRENQTLHQGNGISYSPNQKLSTLQPGMEARLLYKRGNWYQVQFPGGELGWIPEDATIVGSLDRGIRYDKKE